jgi:hypothetical protein
MSHEQRNQKCRWEYLKKMKKQLSESFGNGCEVWEQRDLHLMPGTPDVVQDTATEELSS